jgi:hypothetical protein
MDTTLDTRRVTEADLQLVVDLGRFAATVNRNKHQHRRIVLITDNENLFMQWTGKRDGWNFGRMLGWCASRKGEPRDKVLWFKSYHRGREEQLATVIHEVTHAMCGNSVAHEEPFRRLYTAIGALVSSFLMPENLTEHIAASVVYHYTQMRRAGEYPTPGWTPSRDSLRDWCPAETKFEYTLRVAQEAAKHVAFATKVIAQYKTETAEEVKS